MSSITIALIVFAATFGSAVLGVALRRILPATHLSTESKETINVATGLLATLAALVLGLLVASAKSTFDAEEAGYQQLSASVIVLDRLLADYGHEAADARAHLHKTLEATLQRLDSFQGMPAPGLAADAITTQGESLYSAIRKLEPKSEAQRAVLQQAVEVGADLSRTRWLMSQQQDSASSIPFLIVLLFWLSAIFLSFGLFAPGNAAVMTSLLVCALSAAGAVFLIVELSRPSSGLIHVSSEPLQFALTEMGK